MEHLLYPQRRPFSRTLWLAAAMLGLSGIPALGGPVQTGVLACSVAPGIGIVIGSSKSLSCVYHPVRGKPERYAGTISRIGLDIGATGAGQFTWSVIAPGPTPRYALAGEYSGPGIGVAIGAGAHGNALVGGYGNSISLQPLTGDSPGLNLSAGIGALSLQPVAGAPARRPRHG